MEVDQQKETDAPDGLSICHLPNEVLLTIFRNLANRQLLEASAVCHRWNELTFFLLKDRISLELRPLIFRNTKEWTQNRTYTSVSFRSTLERGFDNTWLLPLVEDVRQLRLYSDFANAGVLQEFLRLFNAVETLLVEVDHLECSSSFVPVSRGMLPSVRHLTFHCPYVRTIGLLAEVAPRLVTLDVELLASILPKFYKCQLFGLESLTLRIKTCQSNSIPAAELIRFLRRMRNLRKLGLFLDSSLSTFRVAFALPNIEDLTLGITSLCQAYSIFNGICDMTRLRSLQLDLETSSEERFERPLPSLETLRINEQTKIPMTVLTTTFPNLKVLSMKYKCPTDNEACLIVSAWRYTMENLTIGLGSITESMISIFTELKQLRKICFNIFGGVKDNISAFAVLTSLDTLKELHIRRLRGMAWRASAVELGNCNCACAIFINERPIEQVILNV